MTIQGTPDPILVAFRPHPQSRDIKQLLDGEWRVVPPIKPLHAGDEVVWHAIGAHSFVLILPAIFVDTNPAAVPTSFGFEARTRVVDNPAPNYYEYEAICDGVHAKGLSAPGVIVD